MYLKDVEEFEPSEEAGRYGRAVTGAQRADVPFPQIYHLFAYRPRAAHALGRFMQETMRNVRAITPGQAELIAAFTSARNDCGF